jgi:two-component system chemotaxis response regulator CheY
VLTTRRRGIHPRPVPSAWILVADDDRDIRELLVEFLAESGFETVEAEDGVRALEVLEARRRPCLVLLDLMMPRMTGYEVLRRLQPEIDAGQLKVIVLTAGVPNTALLGDTEVLRKPFDIRNLLSAIQGHCAA